jgi:hypothetical protein
MMVSAAMPVPVTVMPTDRRVASGTLTDVLPLVMLAVSDEESTEFWASENHWSGVALAVPPTMKLLGGLVVVPPLVSGVVSVGSASPLKLPRKTARYVLVGGAP